MLQADWQRSYASLEAATVDLGLQPGQLAEITEARLERGFWVEGDTDTLYVIGAGDGREKFVRVQCWNRPDARVAIMDILCKPVWRV